MKKNPGSLIILIIAAVLLNGCMYPQEKIVQNLPPTAEQIKAVQTAVEKFQKDNGGILPIKTREKDTPIFEKYPIDFEKLVPKYLAEPPGNAFEGGGVFQYVLVDAETNPQVKIFDLRIAETIQELQIRIKTRQYPPFKEQLAANVFTLDYKKLGYKEDPTVLSPYSGKRLPLLIDGQGIIYVDYRIDLFEAVKKHGENLVPGEDIRFILVEDSHFVPAYSLPYKLAENLTEPVFFEEVHSAGK
ncbi:hypothetical protein J9303_06610 [Bacillaceae bacterium Marseille-Q3522]|nr:hypothetical protein [Bacillaceae bacterium Marseille-Q3522]